MSGSAACRATTVALAVATVLLAANVPARADRGHDQGHDESASQPPALRKLGSLTLGGAEIAAYDPEGRRLYVTNADANSVAIVNATDPHNLSLAATIYVSPLGSPNSVAVRNGIVAVALENSGDKTRPGRVAFYGDDGRLLASVEVGALPDMLTFTPDGRHLLVANEGEPSGYGTGFTDPEGSVSIIRLPPALRDWRGLGASSVRTVRFTAFDGSEAALRARGIRIYGPGASASQDLEPEYIAVSEDSRTAFVTLQENNAVARIDIAGARLEGLMPLGYKDWNRQPAVVASYEWPDESLPEIGRTAGGQVLRLGGFSGLAFEGTTRRGELKFVAITDRGPNGEPNAASERPFVLPDFTPRIVRFTLDPANGKFRITDQIRLRDSDGSPLSGLPNLQVAGGNPATPHNDEVPIDLFGQVLPLDRRGGDFEGVVVAEDGSFWAPDEYRPALYHFSAKGVLLERFIPVGAHAAAGLPVPAIGTAGQLGIEALPAIIAQRRQNRGMEAIAIRDGKIYGFVQSPVRNPASLANSALNALRNIRIVEFDPATRATRQFLYVMDNPASTGPSDTRADKIGDAVATPEGFLVIERDDDAVPASDLSVITKKVYAFALAGATDITGRDAPVDVGGGVLKTLDQMTAAELAAAGVTPVAKTLDVDLAAAGYAGVQKVEGLALLGDGRIAVVNDNDFQVAQIVIDNATGGFTPAPGYVPESIVLGIIDRPGLDASDRDSRISIRPWPVLGMFEPDAIATFRDKGRTYFVTANEGDARDWPGYSEEVRVSTQSLDPVAFPNGSALKGNTQIGRLNISRAQGDLGGDNDLDQLFTLGGRSFSIWSDTGELVFDSGSSLERITAAAFPDRFNAGHDDPAPDNRSDNKGPEPEGIAVGEIRGRRYVFVALERIGGVVTWDITNPRVPVFVDYANDRSFGTPETGDIGPEGVLYVEAKDSPSRTPLVVVTSEISGSVSIWAVDEPRRGGRRDGWSGFGSPRGGWWRWK
jgi:YVTN family beta-propeller protein